MSAPNAGSAPLPVGPGVRRLQAVTAAALVLIVVYCAIGISVPAGLGWDFANFYDAGHRVAAGQMRDLYQQERPIDGQPPQGQMRFWGTPLSAVPLSALSLFRPSTALVVFKIENTLALFLALVLLYRHCRRFVEPGDEWWYAAAFAVMSLLFQPFWTVFRVGGQTTPTVFLLLVLALVCHTQSRMLLSASLLVAVAMIKPAFAVMLLVLVFVSGPGFLAALASALAVAGVVSLAVMGWDLHLDFLRVLLEGSQLSRPWVFNSSLYVPIENLRLRAHPGSSAASMLAAAEWAVRIAVVALCTAVVRRSRRETWPLAARRHFEFLMAVAFWLLTAQLLWEHYLAPLFLLLAYFAAARRALSPLARALVAGSAALALGQNLILAQYVDSAFDVSSAPALLFAGVLKAGPLLCLLALMALRSRDVTASYGLPVWREREAGPRAMPGAAPAGAR